MSKRYLERGVSSKKEDVHKAIKNQDKGIYKNSFCKIIPDILSGDKDYCNIMHADGAGTKSSLAYLYWKETNDLSVWRGIAQDSLIMNIDDLLCVGATENIMLSSTIGRNKKLITGDVLKAIIEGNELVISKLRCYYCRKECLLIYKTVREQKQWTLDRLDNSIGHTKDNVVISCLKCNLDRRCQNDKKFLFTKQMKIVKKD